LENSLSSWGRWLRRSTTIACYAYLAALLVGLLSLRFVGDHFWFTGVAMYLPRAIFGLPCLVLVPLCLLLGMPRLLWTQLAAAVLVVFPLMGFVVPRPIASASGTSLRVLSYNIESCNAGVEKLVARIQQYQPDVVLMQEVCFEHEPLAERLQQIYPEVNANGQFLLASRYPITGVRGAGRFQYAAGSRTERFMRYQLETPFGPIAFYNVHPVSPRFAFYAVGGMRVRTSLKDGSFWRGGAAEGTVRENVEVRERQLAAASRMAAAETVPRILCGDTNMTSLSPVLAQYFGNYQDGFSSAGWGFGYTFPTGEPWMRLDRIMASDELRFVSFQVGCGDASDHQCVIAQIDRRER
jgi:endonuclease/exonuclease/phosphatase (EEP) superfamily protein YafD